MLLQINRFSSPSLHCLLSFLLQAWIVQSSQPAPVNVPVQNDWLGDDGNWSPATIRIGTPPQFVNVIPSTISQETWVIGAGGCGLDDICPSKRGGIFKSNISTTWKELSFFELGLDRQLSFGGVGDYGLDSIALDNQISVPSQIVSIVNDIQYWAGYLGLGIKPTNFTDADEPTFLSSLVQKGSIPSYSYGFTAGAYHRNKHVPASLVLGGYDTNRFLAHNLSFSLDSDQKPTVALNRITTSLRSGGAVTELFSASDSDLFTIDSSTPYLWLPSGPCSRFERTLGLTYDNALQLYLLPANDSRPTNLTFTFEIADQPGSAATVIINIPYTAFGQQLTYPYPNLNATSASLPVTYFPIRKSANASQFVIGRVFLQEAYLIVDYERNNFSISPAVFPTGPLGDVNLVGILPPENTTFSHPPGTIPTGSAKGSTASDAAGLPKGAIAGIGVAGAVLVVLVIGAVVFWCRRRPQKRPPPAAKDSAHECPAELKPEHGLSELPNLDANHHVRELPGSNAIVELPESDRNLPAYTATEKKMYYNSVVPINPNHPVELPNDSRIIELPDESSVQAFNFFNASPSVSATSSQRRYSPRRSIATSPISSPGSVTSPGLVSPAAPSPGALNSPEQWQPSPLPSPLFSDASHQLPARPTGSGTRASSFNSSDGGGYESQGRSPTEAGTPTVPPMPRMLSTNHALGRRESERGSSALPAERQQKQQEHKRFSWQD